MQNKCQLMHLSMLSSRGGRFEHIWGIKYFIHLITFPNCRAIDISQMYANIHTLT